MASADGRRLPGVLVVVEAGPWTRTEGDGAYRLEGVEAGEHRIALVAPGCQITFAMVAFAPGQVRSVAFEIDFAPEAAEGSTRRRSAMGKVVTAREIEAMNAPTLRDVLARMAPGMVGSTPGQPGMDPKGRSRSPVGVRGDVAPAVILDGVILGESGFRILQDIRPSDVAWLEVQRGAAGGWEVGTGGSGGLLRIQTKRGASLDAPLLDPERCDIPHFGVLNGSAQGLRARWNRGS